MRAKEGRAGLAGAWLLGDSNEEDATKSGVGRDPQFTIVQLNSFSFFQKNCETLPLRLCLSVDCDACAEYTPHLLGRSTVAF